MEAPSERTPPTESPVATREEQPVVMFPEDDSAMSLQKEFENITKGYDYQPTRIQKQQRQAFLNRYASFRNPAWYFAKPLELSPILMARFGFRCVEADLLQCDGCKRYWHVPTHDLDTSAHARRALIARYENTLQQGCSSSTGGGGVHSFHCRFLPVTQKYYSKREEAMSSSQHIATNILFETLLPIFPPEEIPLWTSVSRIHPGIFLKTWMPLFTRVKDILESTGPISDLAQRFEATDAVKTVSSAMVRECMIKTAQLIESNDNDGITERASLIATAWILSGFRVLPSDEGEAGTSNTRLVLRCSICQRTCELAGYFIEADKREAQPQTPELAHAYYCPYNNGLPLPREVSSLDSSATPTSTPPFSSILLRRLVSFSETSSGPVNDYPVTNDPARALIDVHAMLRTSSRRLSRKRKQIPS